LRVKARAGDEERLQETATRRPPLPYFPTERVIELRRPDPLGSVNLSAGRRRSDYLSEAVTQLFDVPFFLEVGLVVTPVMARAAGRADVPALLYDDADRVACVGERELYLCFAPGDRDDASALLLNEIPDPVAPSGADAQEVVRIASSPALVRLDVAMADPARRLFTRRVRERAPDVSPLTPARAVGTDRGELRTA
jgi:hypothetical protein